jgi:hypothetical protein
MLYSGFFFHWGEVVESVQTYTSYAQRAGGAGHAKPWYYYIMLLVWHRNFFLWTELAIVLPALIGMGRAFFGHFQKDTHKQAFLVFLSTYALLGLLAYSIIPYKTPWTILSIQHVLILLAGVGIQWLYSSFHGRFFHYALTAVGTCAIYHLCAQTMYTINDRGSANLRAPYVYTHTSTTAIKLIQRLRALSEADPEHFQAQVINQNLGWPMGWYLRDLGDRIGYHEVLPETLAPAPVLVVDSDLAPAIQAKFPQTVFETDHFSLREGVPLTLLVEKSLADKVRSRP